MKTSAWGYRIGMTRVKSPEMAEVMRAHFIRLYLINTGQITSRPSSFWLEKVRVMRQFRSDAKLLGVEATLNESLALLPNVSWKYKLFFSILYLISYAMPSQEAYFGMKRLAAWGRPFETHTLSLTLPE